MHPRRTLEAASVTTHLRLRDTQWIRRATHPFGLEGFSSRSKKIKQPPKKGQFKLPPTIFSFQQMEQPVAGIGRWVMRLKLSDWSLLLQQPFSSQILSSIWRLFFFTCLRSRAPRHCFERRRSMFTYNLSSSPTSHSIEVTLNKEKTLLIVGSKKSHNFFFFERHLEVIVTLAIASLRCCKTVKDQVMQTSDTSSKIESLRRVGCRS